MKSKAVRFNICYICLGPTGNGHYNEVVLLMSRVMKHTLTMFGTNLRWSL